MDENKTIDELSHPPIQKRESFKTKLHRLWIDLIRWKEWTVVQSYRIARFKVKDYDRLENDYSKILCEFCGLSNTNYKVEDMISLIYQQQEKMHHKTIYDDLKPMLDENDWDSIKNYIEELL